MGLCLSVYRDEHAGMVSDLGGYKIKPTIHALLCPASRVCRDA